MPGCPLDDRFTGRIRTNLFWIIFDPESPDQRLFPAIPVDHDARVDDSDHAYEHENGHWIHRKIASLAKGCSNCFW